MQTLHLLLLISATLGQNPTFNVPGYIAGNRLSQMENNPALTELLLQNLGINVPSMCYPLPSIGHVSLGVRSFMRNIEAELAFNNKNTRFYFIYYDEKKENGRLFITAVSRLIKPNGDGGYIIHKVIVNPYSNPTIKVVLYYFSQSLAKIQALAGTDNQIDPNGYVGCGDMKAVWSNLTQMSDQGSPKVRPPAPNMQWSQSGQYQGQYAN